MAKSFAQPVVCPVLIGRASAVAVLDDLIDGLVTPRSQVLLISGDAGIGKSRLVSEAKTYASARGVTVLQGTCFPQDTPGDASSRRWPSGSRKYRLRPPLAHARVSTSSTPLA